MARNRAAQHCSIKPWLTAKTDCKEGRFIQVGNSLLLSAQFKALKHTTKVLYLGMTMESGGKPSFKFAHSAAKKYGISPTTVDRAIKELQNTGFIILVPDEDRSQFKTNVFRFSNDWKSKPSPHRGDIKK